MKLIEQSVLVCTLGLLSVSMRYASAAPNVLSDPQGDAVIRRTDLGNNGPIRPGAVLPDVISISLAPWMPANADGLNEDGGPRMHDASDIHSQPRERGVGQADIFQLTVVFDGLVNPPGPLGLASLPYNPFEYGNSPLYGFIEFDVDQDINTGGERGGSERSRYLANVARFGEVPPGTLGTRTALDGTQLDSSFWTPPQTERSGSDFALVLCGCFQLSIANSHGDNDGKFNAGDTWDMSGRFFQRAGVYEPASAAFGGSFFGLYDPIILLRFSHNAASNRTTLTLQFPLTMEGAAILTGTPVQPIDLNVANHFSIVEALDDVIAGAEGGLSGPTQVLVGNWAGRNPFNYLNTDTWRMTALFGTTYDGLDPSGALYIWTDAAGNHGFADFNSSGTTDAVDLSIWDQTLATRDGTAQDADGVVNHSVQVPNFGENFSVYDVTGDGMIDIADRSLFVLPLVGDANGDCSVDFQDITNILFYWGTSYLPTPGTGQGDSSRDGVVDFADITSTLAAWGTTCPN